jgi:dipeptidyl-peptidase-4
MKWWWRTWCAGCAGVAGAAGIAAAAEIQLDDAAIADLERLIVTRGYTRGLPRDPMPSPDGKCVYFLQSGPEDQRQELHRFDVATGASRRFVTLAMLGGEAKLSPEEQARRERERQTERGITRFEVSRDGSVLLIPYSGDLFVVTAAGGQARRLTQSPAPELDAHLSRDARRVAFLRGNDLVVQDLATGAETEIAHSDDPEISYGAAEFIALEEMDRRTGHWWSPDGTHLAFTEVDTRGVPRFRLPDFDDPTGEGSTSPYPKAGDPNAKVRLGVVAAAGGAARWFDLGAETEYLARVAWSPDSRALWVQTQPRSQEKLVLQRFEVATGAARTVLVETDSDWVNLHDDFHLLERGDRFLWSSERTGHAHLELRGDDGRLLRALTAGDWDVTRTVHVDEKNGRVYFTGTRDGVTEQHLYRVPLGGGAVERLTKAAGWHDASFHPRGHDVWVVNRSNMRTPPRFEVVRRGAPAGTLPSVAATPPALGRLDLMRLRSAEGVDLDVRVAWPTTTTLTGAPMPLVVYVYGGPGAQQVRNAWLGERGVFDSWLAARGFAVARIDGRGVRPRGHESERIFARRMGEHEIDDQVAGVRALQQRYPQLDRARTGIWGWSYGGYATLMALGRAPAVFKAGVAVAPVVDWRGYDTHYTERYLDSPAANTPGYDASSVLTHIGGMRGYLALVHGATDDNVHFRESMVLVRSLVEHGKRFDVMVYPGTHMIESLPERSHLYRLVWRTFAERL